MVHNHIKAGDHVIDATLGAGKDTFVIAKILGGDGKITGYDIQEQALVRTEQTLAALTPKERSIITLKHASHALIKESGVALVIYNLGYLPGGDKTITTCVETTLQSIQSALIALNERGMLLITCYPGHEEGAKEEAALLHFFSNLNKKWKVAYTRLLNREKAPSTLTVTRSNGI